MSARRRRASRSAPARAGAEPDRREPEHLDHAEDASEHVVRDRALEEREPGDVDDELPAPTTPSTTSATATCYQRPIATSGSPTSDDARSGTPG